MNKKVLLLFTTLVLLGPVAIAVAKGGNSIIFQSVGKGQGLVIWGASQIPNHVYDDPPQYATTLDDGFTKFVGKGLLEESILPLEGEVWGLRDIVSFPSFPSMTAEWTQDGVKHQLKVKFGITETTQGEYGKMLSGWGRPSGSVFTVVETVIIGLNVEKYDSVNPDSLYDVLDPQFATMTFQGTFDGQAFSGKANVMSWSVDEYKEDLMQVNLWASDGTYATIGWLPWDITYPFVGLVPAARTIEVNFRLP